MNIKQIKEEIIASYDENEELFKKCSKDIFAKPELGLKEYFASERLSKLLEDEGFSLQRGIEEFGTAFIASFENGAGPKIAFIAEFDALPELGHACGHNIIGTASTAAAIILKKAMTKNNIKGLIKVIGTPAEESFGAKVDLIEKGVFKELDYAMMLHPADASMYEDISFACAHYEYEFKGKAAHSAAAPWQGASALSAVIELFNGSNALRLHLKDHTRLHGIITHGGSADNIIPDKAVAVFNIRALDNEYLESMIEKMNNCAKAAALMCGVEVDIKQLGNRYKEVKNDKFLEEVFKNNFAFIKEPTIRRELNQGIGSTDMGNVTHELSAIHAYIKLLDGGVTHTKEFARAAGAKEGELALSKAAKVLALSALDSLLK